MGIFRSPSSQPPGGRGSWEILSHLRIARWLGRVAEVVIGESERVRGRVCACTWACVRRRYVEAGGGGMLAARPFHVSKSATCFVFSRATG